MQTEPLQTVEEWCATNNLSRRFFYRLLARREAPDTILVGRKRLISPAATIAWRERHTQRQAA
jgi:hypothetical protein